MFVFASIIALHETNFLCAQPKNSCLLDDRYALYRIPVNLGFYEFVRFSIFITIKVFFSTMNNTIMMLGEKCILLLMKSD